MFSSFKVSRVPRKSAVLSTLPTAAAVGSAEIGRIFSLMIPIPFLTILVAVTFAGAVGGRGAGLIAGSMASLFIFHAAVAGFGPATLTGGPFQMLLGTALYCAAGFLIGQIRDQRDESIQRLRKLEDSLRTSLELETAARQDQQEKFGESEARLDRAIRIAQLGYFEFDSINGRCEFCTENHAAKYGLSAKAFMAQFRRLENELARVHPEDREFVSEEFRKLRGGTPIDLEYRILTADGGSRYIRDITEPVFDENGRVAKEVGTSIDVTELRQAEIQLRQIQKLESVGQLTAGIAHDFNNILAIVLGNLEILEQKEERPEEREVIESAMAASLRGSTLTRQLLAFGRKSILLPETTDVAQVVETVEEMMRRTLPANVQIHKDLSDELWSIEVDRSQLEAALLNLAINARDAMPDGGTLTVEATNRWVDGQDIDSLPDGVVPGSYVVVAVRDDGEGMTEEVRSRLFEPFFTTKGEGDGSGLGLSMVLGFTQQSGGGVGVESGLGHGTTINLFFPARPERAPAVAEAPCEPKHTIANSEQILVVEDSKEVRDVVVRHLKRQGFSVTVDESGDAALARIAGDEEFDLLLTDVVMPGSVQGPELVERAREMNPDLRVIFMSGYPKDALKHGQMEFGDTQLLLKPFSSVDLLAAVRTSFKE